MSAFNPIIDRPAYSQSGVSSNTTGGPPPAAGRAMPGTPVATLTGAPTSFVNSLGATFNTPMHVALIVVGALAVIVGLRALGFRFSLTSSVATGR